MNPDADKEPKCACKSIDRYDCWVLRYYRHTNVSRMRIDEDGGPCECDCHDAHDDDEYPEYGGQQDWPGDENAP